MLTEDAPFAKVELVDQVHLESSWADGSPIGRVLGAVGFGCGLW